MSTTENQLTPEQVQLGTIVRQSLLKAAVRFEEVAEGIPDGSTVVTFYLHLPRNLGLDVSIWFGIDAFGILANTADLRLQVQDAGNDPARWVQMCAETVKALLGHDLRIRVRRTLFGGTTGAIWVPMDDGHWNGDLWAYLGCGREMVFPSWSRQDTTER